jgi:glycosyltransferase involved in cell wall biosynthesis
MKQKRVLIWSTAVGDFVDGDKSVGGIAVQLYFWAQIFAKKGWQVTTLTHSKSFIKDDIAFKRVRRHKKFKILHEWLSVFREMLLVRPHIVISRGAGRISYPLAIVSRWFGVKFVFFGASDVNFEPGKELIAGGEHNRKLWHKAVKKIKYIVVQNAHQQETLKKNYQKDSLMLFNLWGEAKTVKIPDFQTDVVWVANLRRLKRADWMVNAAKALPQYDFTIVGGRTGQEPEYYDEIEKMSSGISNLHFLGKKSFAETNAIVSQSRLLCCTSTFEGFPNTFLQAWAFGIPVVSTVNPSDVITTNNLGVVVEAEDGFRAALQSMLSNTEEYKRKCMAVEDYFEQHHSPEVNYQKLVEYLDLETI